MPNAQVDREENTFWPWVLGLVVLALVVWVAAEVSGEGGGEIVPEPVVMAAPSARTTGASLQAWVRDSAEMQERSGSTGSYAAAGMTRVAAALRTLAAGDAELFSRIDSIAAGAARLDSLTVSEERVVALQMQFEQVLGILRTRSAADESEVAQRLLTAAGDAAAALDPAVPLEQQRHRIFTFFDHVSELIRLASAPAER